VTADAHPPARQFSTQRWRSTSGGYGRSSARCALLCPASAGNLQAPEPVPAVDGGGTRSIWGSGAPSGALIVPLDTRHQARPLPAADPISAGWKMAADITASLRSLDAVDPVRFDFSICHVGMMNACGFGRKQGDSQCPLKGLCHPRLRRARPSG
jgi:hypothetical protein